MIRTYLELKDREVIDIPAGSPGLDLARHFGVSLDNQEAQALIADGLRVFGDDMGPYLVVRLKASQPDLCVADRKHVDVKVEPIRWQLNKLSGTICWLEKIS